MPTARPSPRSAPSTPIEFALAVADVDRGRGLEEARRVLELAALDPLIELRCAFLLLNLDDPGSARDCVARIRSRIPDDWPWAADLIHLGRRIALAAGNRELAEPLLARAFEAEPENPENGRFLARLYRDMGDDARARRVVEQALGHSPDNRRLSELRDELSG